MHVAKWGNSLAVRLPKALVESMGLKAGDEVNVTPLSEQGEIGVRKIDRRAQFLEGNRLSSIGRCRRATGSIAKRPIQGDESFVDTNVFVYAFLAVDPKRAARPTDTRAMAA